MFLTSGFAMRNGWIVVCVGIYFACFVSHMAGLWCVVDLPTWQDCGVRWTFPHGRIVVCGGSSHMAGLWCVEGLTIHLDSVLPGGSVEDWGQDDRTRDEISDVIR